MSNEQREHLFRTAGHPLRHLQVSPSDGAEECPDELPSLAPDVEPLHQPPRHAQVPHVTCQSPCFQPLPVIIMTATDATATKDRIHQPLRHLQMAASAQAPKQPNDLLFIPSSSGPPHTGAEVGLVCDAANALVGVIVGFEEPTEAGAGAGLCGCTEGGVELMGPREDEATHAGHEGEHALPDPRQCHAVLPRQIRWGQQR
ncbi:hypothetical protein Pelo_16039 [Pelomyxa schiedti]|nr:hypothetical protein Pelo_16039 [Pelomyxa schiedti]